MRAALFTGAAGLSFASIGDWGGAGVGGYRATNEKEVAAQLAKTAAEKKIEFVLNTGDNFYYCGTKDVNDAQFKTVFEDVFADEALYVPWYSILGNHDYAYDVESQVQYKSPNKDRWKMPARYYSERIQLAASQYMTLIALDTSPCFADYVSNDSSKWDPCSPQFKDECLSPQGTCDFHERIMKADPCSKQAAWLKETLDKVPEGDWIVVIGHNPSYQIDVADMTSLLLAKPIHLYLNGHVHTLSQYQYSSHEGVGFITTGAGCMVHTKDQDDEHLFDGGDAHSFAFNEKKSGFTLHTFSEDFSTLTTDYIDVDGNKIHSFTVSKSGSPTPGPAPGPSPPAPKPTPPAPSPPAPSPSPAPGPAKGSCATYGCSYGKTHSCQCNSYCKYHKDCCHDYEQVCRKSELTYV